METDGLVIVYDQVVIVQHLPVEASGGVSESHSRWGGTMVVPVMDDSGQVFQVSSPETEVHRLLYETALEVREVEDEKTSSSIG